MAGSTFLTLPIGSILTPCKRYWNGELQIFFPWPRVGSRISRSQVHVLLAGRSSSRRKLCSMLRIGNRRTAVRSGGTYSACKLERCFERLFSKLLQISAVGCRHITPLTWSGGSGPGRWDWNHSSFPVRPITHLRVCGAMGCRGETHGCYWLAIGFTG